MLKEGAQRPLTTPLFFSSLLRILCALLLQASSGALFPARAEAYGGPPAAAPPFLAKPHPRRAPGRRVQAKADPYAGWISVEPRRWPHIPWPPPTETGRSRAGGDPVSACIARLAALGIEAAPAAPRASAAAACIIATPVHLKAVRPLSSAPAVVIAGTPEIDCAMAERFGAFTREILAPLAGAYMGTTLVSISAAGFYCRPVDSVPGNPPSPHGKGIAIDVSSFAFANGRRLDIGRDGTPEGEAFFKALRTAACGYFTTVLGPGADADHATHMHVDLKLHGSSDRYRICQ